MVRHADAHHTTIHADATRDEVTLQVCDDGRGTSGPDGSGLAGMRERITALGGHVIRRTGPSGGERPGTAVTISLPRTPSMPAAPSPATRP